MVQDPNTGVGLEPARHVAVVGSGPSGLFAAQALVSGDPRVRVDVLDRLPTPYGLLRYGVAPDHTSIRSIATALARVFDDPRITFHGMVQFGRDVTRQELLAAYDAVVYAAGASEDVRLGVPGEDLPGSASAREFVAWYGGHPDAAAQDLSGVTSAAAIGVGNVAIDVARVLAKDPADLEATDMPPAVLAQLRRHAVRDIWIIGRRGPAHASFTTAELRELVTLPGVDVIVHGDVLRGIDAAVLDRRTRANVDVLRRAAGHTSPWPRCRLHFVFWHRPLAFTGDDRLEAMTLEPTEADEAGGVVGTGERTTIPVQLALRAIGYRGVPLPEVPFDAARGVIPNHEGRVLDAPGGVPCPGEYVVGWIKRGPLGVIGTNKSDAGQTVRHLLDDLAVTTQPLVPRAGVGELLASRGLAASTFADWERIDAAERRRGAARGRDRTKIEEWSELVDLLAHERPGGPATPGDRR